MRDWSPSLVYVSVALMVAGFVLIILGWNGSASRDFVEGQLPYVISGGIAGLGLLASGLALALVQELRRCTARIEAKLEWMAEVTAARARSGPPGAAERTVVAGRTSYHDPDCHLISGREDLRATSVEGAREQGLDPCRVCSPDGEHAPTPEATATA